MLRTIRASIFLLFCVVFHALLASKGQKQQLRTLINSIKMETFKIRKMIGETIRVAGIVIWLLGTDYVSGFLSGFLNRDIAFNEILLLGNSLCHWGIVLVVGGYILKMYCKGLSKKTKRLVFIPCALYVLLYLWTLMFPADRISDISFSPTLLAGLLIIGSLAFWGALLSGLYRMYREVQVLDRVTKTDTKSVAY